MPIDSQGDLENGEELTNEDLINIKDQLLEATTAQQEVQATEDAATAVEQPETQGTLNTQERRDARKGDASQTKDLFTVDNPEGTLLGANASTKFARDFYDVTSAPAQGVVDTMTDAWNFGTSALPYGNKLNIEKPKKYESDVANAVRNISGLVIPSLGLRGMLIKGATKLHLSGKTAPWLQKLGNRQSFAYFSKFGADVGTGAAVDFVAEQNKVDDNLFGTLKKYWPRTYQFIPETWATNDGDSPDIKRQKNVNEGAILGLLSSVVEGVAYITRAGKSLKRVTTLTSENPQLQKRLDGLTKDEFSDVQFAENPIEDTIMRNAARREQELDNLGAYLQRTKPSIKFDTDTRGQGKFYHGTSEEISSGKATSVESGENLQESNLYGNGFYTTEDLTTASRYQKKNKNVGQPKRGDYTWKDNPDEAYQKDLDAFNTRKENPTVYEINEKQSVKFIDADQKIDWTGNTPEAQTIKNYLSQSDEGNEVLDAWEKSKSFSYADIINDLRDVYSRADLSKGAFTDLLDDLNLQLKNIGYGGITHQGGNLAGKGERLHQVKIYWDAENQIELNKFKSNSEPILGVHDVFDPTESATRTKDADGVLGAAVDATRIAKNVDTSYGRLGSVVSEASLKYGLEVDNRTQEVLIRSLVEEIKNGGRYSAELASGKKLTFDEIDEAGNRLSEVISDPRMSPGDMKKLLDETKKTLEDGVNKVVGKEGYNAVTKTIKKLSDDLLDLDAKKARAYLATSLAGQVSDVAEGVRLMDDNMVMERAIDQIADRLEYLLVEKGIAAYDAGSTLAFMKTWKNASNTKNPKVMRAAGEAMLSEREQTFLDLIPNAKNYAQTLRDTAKTNPDFLRPLLLANELTDGDINSMYQLNKMVSEKLGVFKKAIIDGNPDVAPIINRAWFSNVYNSTLSAFATPIKALQGNLGGLTARPMATLIGAGLSGDWSEIRKAHYTYFSMDDTLINATKHMSKVYRKVATDPSKVSYVMREDIANKVAEELEVLQKYAKAAEANGEYGPQALVTLYENLQAMGDDPWLRFGANSMTAMDGFSRSVVASTEAKSRAFNQLVKDGKDFSKKNLDELSEKIRKDMFDDEGMIDDAGVNYLNSEIALNLDSDTVKGLNGLVNRYPVFKPFLLFPRTSANIIDTFGKYSPMGILSNDYKKMWGTFGNKKITDFGPEEIKEILESRGQVFDETYLQKFRTIRHEVKGKVAMGTVFTMLAVNAAMGDRIHGNGHYNKARQRVRDSLNWKRRSYKIPGTETWASGDILGPLGDWMFTVSDVVDNFDLMSEKGIENALQKLVYIFASSITSRSVLSNLEPMNDIFQGNGFAFNRWAASFGNNAMGPLGSWRNEMGRVINPALRQMKGGMLEGWRNRNGWLDMFDPQGALPEKFDPIDGTRVGYPESIWMRFANTYSPIKFSESISPEKQFLVDVEYDLLTKVNRSIGGAELEEREKSAIFSKMGELGTYKKDIATIMKDANKLVYTGSKYPELNGIKGFINIVKAARKMGLSSEDLPTEKFKGVFDRLDRAFSDAKRQAELNLDKETLANIRQREYNKRVKEHYVKEGNIDQTLQQTLIPTR